MPTGIYIRTKPKTQKQLEAARTAGRKTGAQNIKMAHKLPASDAQREAWRKIGLSTKGKPKPHKGNVFGNDIIKHHNDLCHGAERPDDITYMTQSQHLSLHHKIRVENGTHHFLTKNRQ